MQLSSTGSSRPLESRGGIYNAASSGIRNQGNKVQWIAHKQALLSCSRLATRDARGPLTGWLQQRLRHHLETVRALSCQLPALSSQFSTLSTQLSALSSLLLVLSHSAKPEWSQTSALSRWPMRRVHLSAVAELFARANFGDLATKSAYKQGARGTSRMSAQPLCVSLCLRMWPTECSREL